MADILVRNLAPQTVKRLKTRARQHGRSLQGEAKIVLEQAAWLSPAQIAAMLERWQKHFAGRKFSSSSAELIREDRER